MHIKKMILFAGLLLCANSLLSYKDYTTVIHEHKVGKADCMVITVDDIDKLKLYCPDGECYVFRPIFTTKRIIIATAVGALAFVLLKAKAKY